MNQFVTFHFTECRTILRKVCNLCCFDRPKCSVLALKTSPLGDVPTGVSKTASWASLILVWFFYFKLPWIASVFEVNPIINCTIILLSQLFASLMSIVIYLLWGADWFNRLKTLSTRQMLLIKRFINIDESKRSKNNTIFEF